eukprot:scaffold20481_cov60-Phaeocystis_antarctica.AAC.3
MAMLCKCSETGLPLPFTSKQVYQLSIVPFSSTLSMPRTRKVRGGAHWLWLCLCPSARLWYVHSICTTVQVCGVSSVHTVHTLLAKAAAGPKSALAYQTLRQPHLRFWLSKVWLSTAPLSFVRLTRGGRAAAYRK